VGSKKDYTDAKWAADLWDRMMSKRRKPIHLRGFHYWIQSQGIVMPHGGKYAHKDPSKDWSYLLHCAQVARYLGIGAWNNLLDLKHPEPIDHNTYYISSGLSRNGEVDVTDLINRDIGTLVDNIISQVIRHRPTYDASGYQTYHTEVWCEKGSMGFVIEPACRKYNATYQPLVGQASIEKVNLACQRAIKAARVGKKVRIFYISDWDRYGWDMPKAVARKLEFFKTQSGEDFDIKLARLALNDSHISKFNLPRAPKHGEDVVELDALEAIHPGELQKIIEAKLRNYFDKEKPGIVNKENTRIYNDAKEMLEKELRQPLTELFQGLNLDTVDVDLTKLIDPEFEVPNPDFEAEETDQWILDSMQTYWDQLNLYNKYSERRHS
jgi:hypothetical protein